MTNSDPIPRLNAALEGRYRIDSEVYAGRMTRLVRHVPTTCLVFLVISCGGGDPGTSPTDPSGSVDPVATTISLSLSSLTFSSLGETQSLTATVQDQNGQTMSATATWASSDAAVASVTTGLINAIGNGSATITATSGSATGTASVTVEQVAASVALSLDSLVLDAPGDTATVSATVEDAGGSEILSPLLVWSSSDESVLTVDSDGLVTAVASGPATIAAAMDGEEDQITARVKGSFLTVYVIGDGDPLSDVEVFLTDPNLVNTKDTTDASGMARFTGLLPGDHTVTLQAAPVGYSAVNPQIVSIAEDQSHDLTFNGTFPPAQVNGVVRAWGKPVIGASVVMAGKDTVEVFTDVDGLFAVASIRRGEYSITIGGFSGVRFTDTAQILVLESGPNEPICDGSPDPMPLWTSLTVGSSHTCGLILTGEAYCWGYNALGQLGNGTAGEEANSVTPFYVAGAGPFESLSAGWDTTCGVVTSGDAYCWGSNHWGVLGDGTTTNSSVPILVSGGLDFASVTVHAERHACGLTRDGEAFCWGDNELAGQLGDGTMTSSLVPVEVVGNLIFDSLVADDYSTCGLTALGAGYCWGYNFEGQLGDGSTVDSPVPIAVTGGRVFASLSTGFYHRCGVTSGGDGYCWGSNSWGQLGDGGVTGLTVPTPVSGGLSFRSIAGGFEFTCGVTVFDEGYCWGLNRRGRLGNGELNLHSQPPSLLLGGLAFERIWTGEHVCGLTTSGEAFCWGGNQYGQLGDGTEENRSTPVLVGGG